MNLNMKEWLIVTIIIVIIVILIDGFRRMRKARRDSIHMSLSIKNTLPTETNPHTYGSEFPNGGARLSQQQIDKTRIEKIKNQFDYGRDISEIIDQKIIMNKKTDRKVVNKNFNNQAQCLYGRDNNKNCVQKWDNEHEIENKVNRHTETENNDDSLILKKSNLSGYVEENVQKKEVIVGTDTHLLSRSEFLSSGSHLSEAEILIKHKQSTINLEKSVPLLMETVHHEFSTIKSVKNNQQKNTAKFIYKISNLEDCEDKTLDRLPSQNKPSIHSVKTHFKQSIETKINNSTNLHNHSSNKPNHQSKYFSRNLGSTKIVNPLITEILIINVEASTGNEFYGNDLLQEVINNELHYGVMGIFHRYINMEEGSTLFSMANILEPGVFDLKTINTFSTVGISFFMTMPILAHEDLATFELMLTTAKNFASSFRGELKDDQHSIMTIQTIAHYRERILEFSRRQQVKKHK